MKKKLLQRIGIVVAVLAVLAIVAYLTLVARPLETPATVSSLAELEEFLDNLAGYNADSPAGLSLVVVKDGEVVYQEGFGLADGPRNIPTTPETVYNYWSITKIPTAIAVLQLHEQGLLNIDDPVTDYLPFFEVEYPSAGSETITIRHLLNHSSGLSNNVPEIIGWIHTDGDPDWNQTALIQEKLPDYAKLSYEPGSEGVYTNVGYMVLAAIIEAASGQTYEEYIVEHILKPLEMNQTGFSYTPSMIAAEAIGAHPNVDLQTLLLPIVGVDKDTLVREKQDGILWFNHIYSDQNGPTGLIGSPTDLARFAMAYLNGGELNGQRILSEESVTMMTHESHIVPGNTSDAAAFDEMLQGLGWAVVPTGNSFYLTHSGGGPGFS
ncbi:MAG: beta-lactamase family protein, partial [Chloroflexi bacterium]|nr:beta-lactamase family protein [Chloroflexota bacterium]